MDSIINVFDDVIGDDIDDAFEDTIDKAMDDVKVDCVDDVIDDSVVLLSFVLVFSQPLPPLTPLYYFTFYSVIFPRYVMVCDL